MMSSRSLTSIATATLALALLAGVPAQAAPLREVITGDVLQLVSVQDTAAMTSMSPGETVSWDVQVSATEPNGEIALELAAAPSTSGLFAVDVRTCVSEGQECTTAELASAVLAPGEVVQVGNQRADESLWYRIGVRLTGDAPARTVLTFTASGQGDEVSTGGEVELPDTGVSPWLPLALAVGALAVGVLLARLAAVRKKSGRR